MKRENNKELTSRGYTLTVSTASLLRSELIEPTLTSGKKGIDPNNRL